jgi:hypothetical protein
MPGVRLSMSWEGSRNELLASYVLSSVATVVRVPRDADFGLDLLCTLTDKKDNLLYAGTAFGVQVKPASQKAVTYGGLNQHKAEWKRYEIEWLYGQDQPVVLCIVDQTKWEVKLYSTNRIWRLRWMNGLETGRVQLAPDCEAQADAEEFLWKALPQVDDSPQCGDGRSYTIPLGRPIFQLLVRDQSLAHSRCDLRRCLDEWLRLDYKNIMHHRMDIPYMEEWTEWRPNEVPLGLKYHVYHNPEPNQNVREILGSIEPAVVALYANLCRQRQLQKLASLRPILRLIRDYGATHQDFVEACLSGTLAPSGEAGC